MALPLLIHSFNHLFTYSIIHSFPHKSKLINLFLHLIKNKVSNEFVSDADPEPEKRKRNETCFCLRGLSVRWGRHIGTQPWCMSKQKEIWRREPKKRVEARQTKKMILWRRALPGPEEQLDLIDTEVRAMDGEGGFLDWGMCTNMEGLKSWHICEQWRASYRGVSSAAVTPLSLSLRQTLVP